MNQLKKACVIGYPVAHSRSPLIHNYWLKKYNIEGIYQKQDLQEAELQQFVEKIRQGEFIGCNVTIPHKENIIVHIDETDDKVLKIGATNTLYFNNGKIRATNTDAYGFIANLDEKISDWKSTTEAALVIGAGGAARAIIYGLLQQGLEKIYITNRTFERARKIEKDFGKKIETIEFSRMNITLKNADLVINTTNLGMNNHNNLDIDFHKSPDHTIVYDIVYVPLLTKLLESAQSRGLKTVDGLGMLLHQAVPAFEHWFGKKPEVTTDLRQMIIGDLEAC